MPQKSPLKYHGGKSYQTDSIHGLAPKDYITYAEACLGGGSLLLSHDPTGRSEIVNDADSRLTNFWRVLQNDRTRRELVDSLRYTPFSQVEFAEALVQQIPRGVPDVRAARAFFIVNRMSRQGLGKDFATMSYSRVRGGQNEAANAFINTVSQLDKFGKRLRGVVVYNEDILRFIERHDHPKTWFVLDPPYPHETRVTTEDYEFEMSPAEHLHLLEALCEIKGRFLLCTYPNRLYSEYGRAMNWTCHEHIIDNKASGKGTKDKKIEQYWMNY